MATLCTLIYIVEWNETFIEEKSITTTVTAYLIHGLKLVDDSICQC